MFSALLYLQSLIFINPGLATPHHPSYKLETLGRSEMRLYLNKISEHKQKINFFPQHGDHHHV